MNGLVSAKKAQTFTDEEKQQARDNIEAVSKNNPVVKGSLTITE